MFNFSSWKNIYIPLLDKKTPINNGINMKTEQNIPLNIF